MNYKITIKIHCNFRKQTILRLYTFCISNFENLKSTMKKIINLRILRIIAVSIVGISAVGSLFMTLHAGQHNNSILLVVLFVSWVLSPYLALLILNAGSKHWQVLTRETLYYLMILLSIISLISYSGVVIPHGMKPAFIFLVIPLISWMLILIVLPITANRSRRKSMKSDIQ